MHNSTYPFSCCSLSFSFYYFGFFLLSFNNRFCNCNFSTCKYNFAGAAISNLHWNDKIILNAKKRSKIMATTKNNNNKQNRRKLTSINLLFLITLLMRMFRDLTPLTYDFLWRVLSPNVYYVIIKLERRKKNVAVDSKHRRLLLYLASCLYIIEIECFYNIQQRRLRQIK